MVANNQEIDLVQELNDLFDGTDFGTPKYQTYVHRKMRRNATDGLVRCGACWDNKTQSGRQGCPDCDGLGSLWDESLIQAYVYRPQYIRLVDDAGFNRQVARADNNGAQMITASEIKINSGDHIYSIKYTDNGMISIPVVFTEKYYVTNSIPLRLDHNRIEFSMSALIKV